MLFAFIYLVLQKRQVLSESKGEALFSTRISSLLLLLSVVSFIVRPPASLTLRLLPVMRLCFSTGDYLVLQQDTRCGPTGTRLGSCCLISKAA